MPSEGASGAQPEGQHNVVEVYRSGSIGNTVTGNRVPFRNISVPSEMFDQRNEFPAVKKSMLQG